MLAGNKTESKSTACVNTDSEAGKVETPRPKKDPELRQYVAAVEEVFPALEKIILGYEKGSYALRADGSPDKTTLQAIREIVEDAASGMALSAHDKKRFLNFMERAIVRWFRDCVLQSQGIATLRFRRMLTSISSKISE